METLLLISLAIALGAVYINRRQRGRLLAQGQVIRRQDEEIRNLQSRLSTLERQGTARQALSTTVAEAAFDLLLLLDDELRIVHFNQAAKRLFRQSNPVGLRLQDVINSPELHGLAGVARREVENLEEQFVIADAHFRARTHVMPAVGEGRYIGIALQNITELVNLNRARRDLVANISHELRTPITRIRLIIEGLFLDADKPKRKASIQSLKEIATETDALLWLAQELLDLSMIESGQAILRLVKTPLQQAVEDAIFRLESQAETKRVTIASHVAQRSEVLSDPDQLRRVLDNLLRNAIKWSPANGAITISASEQADEVTVSILDNGPGVADDLVDRVFERFYQADVSRSGDEGAGLGLAICKHIVEAHGGRIWAEGNGQGLGGHFLFTLLKADVDPQPAMEEAGPIAAPVALDESVAQL